MKRRTRKFIGTIFLVVFVIFYALAVMVVAQVPVLQTAPRWVHLVFYAVAGLAWAVPIIPVIKWMERLDPEDAA